MIVISLWAEAAQQERGGASVVLDRSLGIRRAFSRRRARNPTRGTTS
jgi:hypothetical protein